MSNGLLTSIKEHCEAKCYRYSQCIHEASEVNCDETMFGCRFCEEEKTLIPTKSQILHDKKIEENKMTDIMAQLQALTDKDWGKLFSHMESEARKFVQNLDEDLKYRYLGEIDDPTEMYEDFATAKDVKGKGKTNWFICSDGSFLTCGDAAVDALFDTGKCVNYEFPFEEERREKYNSLSYEEKIAFRVALQGISESLADEIVSCEEDEWYFDDIYR